HHIRRTERWHNHSQRGTEEVRPVRIRSRCTWEQVMRKNWVLAGAAVLVAAPAAGGVVATSGAKRATAAAKGPAANTETVERGKLADMVSQYGTLTHRARAH